MAYIGLRVAVGACRDERRHAELVPMLSRHFERRTAGLPSRVQPVLRRVMEERGRDGMAGQKRIADIASKVFQSGIC